MGSRWVFAFAFAFASASALGPVYTKRQRQHCNDACDSVFIENNRVAPEWVRNPFSSDSTVFNENRITSVIAVLTLMLGVNGPLILRMDIMDSQLCYSGRVTLAMMLKMVSRAIYKRQRQHHANANTLGVNRPLQLGLVSYEYEYGSGIFSFRGKIFRNIHEKRTICISDQYKNSGKTWNWFSKKSHFVRIVHWGCESKIFWVLLLPCHKLHYNNFTLTQVWVILTLIKIWCCIFTLAQVLYMWQFS